MADEVANADRREHDPVDAGKFVGYTIIRHVHEDVVSKLVHGQVISGLQLARLLLVLLIRVELELRPCRACLVRDRRLGAV